MSIDTDVVPNKLLEKHKHRENGIDHATSWVWAKGRREKHVHEQFLRNLLTEAKDATKEIEWMVPRKYVEL